MKPLLETVFGALFAVCVFTAIASVVEYADAHELQEHYCEAGSIHHEHVDTKPFDFPVLAVCAETRATYTRSLNSDTGWTYQRERNAARNYASCLEGAARAITLRSLACSQRKE